jgi:hypothetical protein
MHTTVRFLHFLMLPTPFHAQCSSYIAWPLHGQAKPHSHSSPLPAFLACLTTSRIPRMQQCLAAFQPHMPWYALTFHHRSSTKIHRCLSKTHRLQATTTLILLRLMKRESWRRCGRRRAAGTIGHPTGADRPRARGAAHLLRDGLLGEERDKALVYRVMEISHEIVTMEEASRLLMAAKQHRSLTSTYKASFRPSTPRITGSP